MAFSDLRPRDIRSLLLTYSIALVAYGVASAGTILFWESFFKDMPFALFFAAVATAAWYGGFRPGFLVALLGALTTGYLLSTPDSINLGAPITLFVIAALISYLIENRVRSQVLLEGVNRMLEAERGTLEAIIQQMPAAVILAKAPSGELILANQKVEEILRHPFLNVRSIEEYSQYRGYHSDGRPYQPEEYPLARSVKTGVEVIDEEMDYLCGDEIRRTISTTSAPIRDRDNKIIAALMIFSDLTDRKHLERQLTQSQKMDAIGRLAGGIAHDFNNLLTAINGYSELSLSQLHPEDRLRFNLEEIKKAGDRAASLTRQLLTFSRKQVIKPIVLDLNSAVSDIEKMLQRLIGEDIELRTIPGSELGSIKADPGQIEQVLMNLSVNARDAMPQGGKLTIETRNIDLDEEYSRQHIAVTPGPYVMLAVSDSGTGMDAQTQAHIFEPFFTTKEAGKGTGLGLSTVYGIVSQLGGIIWVYSELGRGTTFKVYFPRVDEPAQSLKPISVREEEVLGTETILLAEDEGMLRDLIRRVLTGYGYQVIEAVNGAAALVVCQQYNEPIHLVITDVIMPEMSGRELVTHLLGIQPQIKALYMSGYTDDAIVHHGVLDSGIPFLQKPFTPVELARRVREVLDAPDDTLSSFLGDSGKR